MLIETYYWLEESSLAGLFCFSGSAPPPSRKFTETPDEVPWFVDSRSPLKNGRRLTIVPLYMPGWRMPGTATPTFGCVSKWRKLAQSCGHVRGPATYSFQ